MKLELLMALAVVACVYLGCAAAQAGAQAPAQKPVIVLAAFGTSVPEAQGALESIDTAVRAAMPGYDVRWAFTSKIILKKLREGGQITLFARKTPLQNLAETYAELSKAGVKDVVVQSLHVVPGAEYNEVKNVPAQGLGVRYGLPLLTDEASMKALLGALSAEFKGGDIATILCGHGNDHHAEYNKELVAIDRLARGLGKNAVLATVEGQPGTEQAFADVKGSGAKAVHFVPMMIVAGDHIMNDVMGDEDDSWKKQLGLPATASKGMGANPAVAALFVQRLKEAMK